MADVSGVASPKASGSRGDNAEDAPAVTRFFQVRGKVQNVMFRQTVIRAMLKRELTGGATNDKSDKKLVHVTLHGPSETINELVETIGSGKDLNDWGAMASEVKEVTKTQGKSLSNHQVTTADVDTKQWNPNCTMFI